MKKQRRNILILLFLCYIAALALITLWRPGWKQRLIPEPFWELRLLLASGDVVHWGLQIGLNILLFVPFGILMPALFPRFRKGCVTVPAAMLVSVAIEAVQYLLACGYTETDDVIHNTLGAWIGFCIYRIYKRKTTQ